MGSCLGGCGQQVADGRGREREQERVCGRVLMCVVLFECSAGCVCTGGRKCGYGVLLWRMDAEWRMALRRSGLGFVSVYLSVVVVVSLPICANVGGGWWRGWGLVHAYVYM